MLISYSVSEGIYYKTPLHKWVDGRGCQTVTENL